MARQHCPEIPRPPGPRPLLLHGQVHQRHRSLFIPPPIQSSAPTKPQLSSLNRSLMRHHTEPRGLQFSLEQGRQPLQGALYPRQLPQARHQHQARAQRLRDLVYYGDTVFYTLHHLLVEVKAGSPAHEAGMKARDLMTYVNREPVQVLYQNQVMQLLKSGGEAATVRATPLDSTSIKTGGLRRDPTSVKMAKRIVTASKLRSKWQVTGGRQAVEAEHSVQEAVQQEGLGRDGWNLECCILSSSPAVETRCYDRIEALLLLPTSSEPSSSLRRFTLNISERR